MSWEVKVDIRKGERGRGKGKDEMEGGRGRGKKGIKFESVCA